MNHEKCECHTCTQYRADPWGLNSQLNNEIDSLRDQLKTHRETLQRLDIMSAEMNVLRGKLWLAESVIMAHACHYCTGYSDAFRNCQGYDGCKTLSEFRGREAGRPGDDT